MSIFDSKNWNQVKEKFDSGRNIGEMEDWIFWKDFFDRRKIKASLVTPDSGFDRLIKVPDMPVGLLD